MFVVHSAFDAMVLFLDRFKVSNLQKKEKEYEATPFCVSFGSKIAGAAYTRDH